MLPCSSRYFNIIGSGVAWAGQGSSGRSHLGFQVPRFAKYWKVLEVLDVLYGSGRKIKGLQVLQVAEVPEGCGRYRGFWEVNDSDVREVLEAHDLLEGFDVSKCSGDDFGGFHMGRRSRLRYMDGFRRFPSKASVWF